MPKLQVPVSRSLPEIKRLYVEGGWMKVCNHFNVTVPDLVSLLWHTGHLDEVRAARVTVSKDANRIKNKKCRRKLKN